MGWVDVYGPTASVAAASEADRVMALNRVGSFGELDHAHECAKDGSCRHVDRVLPRLPVEPLLMLTRFSPRELGLAIGRSTRCVQRWQRDGVPVSVADEVACRLGYHPASIWGVSWETVA